MSHPIHEYAMLSDGRSAALVHRSGSIDWLCWPRFDSKALFSRLIGQSENGYWRMSPVETFQSHHRYRGDSMVLETEFTTSDGRARLTDWMSLSAKHRVLFRRLEGLEGEIEMETELKPRFDYGSIQPWITNGRCGLRAVAGPDAIEFCSPVPVTRSDHSLAGRFVIHPGETRDFAMVWDGLENEARFPIPPTGDDLNRTLRHWESWSRRCQYEGPYRNLVVRSLLTLKALIYEPSGGIVAAPTTSLPEAIGGIRNWDYRYCWIRDATYTLYVFLSAGYSEEAKAWRQWLVRTVAGMPEELNIMYGIRGDRRLTEITLDWLEGYEGSKPVRIGNGAYTQRQLDIFGELMDVLHLARRSGIAPEPTTWEIQRELIRFLEKNWDEPDEGIWETRGPRRHFTHSKVMAWVAIDRAIKAVERFGLDGDVDRWKILRARIRHDICKKGYDTATGSFTQSYGSSNVDASLLMIPIVGFLPANDPRVLGTIRRIEKELLHDGFVFRYKTHESSDGLPGQDGAFLPCSFWLVDNYVLSGQREKAERLFHRLASLFNDVGLLSEEYDATEGKMLGNFPQALTHISFVNSAFNLSRRRGPAHDRSESQGDAEPGEQTDSRPVPAEPVS